MYVGELFQMSDFNEQQGSGSASGDQGPGKQQTTSKRFVFTPWQDSQDHELCIHALVLPPERVPSLGRTGTATARWRVVSQGDEAQLICNGLHEGICEWPYTVGSA